MSLLENPLFCTTLAWKIRYSASVEHSEFGQFHVVFVFFTQLRNRNSSSLSAMKKKKVDIFDDSSDF